MKMRESKVLKKLRSGEVVNCLKVNFGYGQIVELVAMLGFDCIWTDMEHVSQDASDVASQVWATKAHDADLLVRVQRGSYSNHIKPLELDATGILVPHVMGLEDAKRVIEMTRFHPIGRRALDGGNADGAYTNLDFKDYLIQANEQRFVVLQIEDPEPLKDLEAIAALEGYDMIFFGPGDFTQGIGAPGDWNHPKLLETRRKVAEVANRYGKFAGTTGSTDNLRDLTNMGYNFISVGADVVGLSNYCKDLLQKFNAGGGKAARNSKGYYK